MELSENRILAALPDAERDVLAPQLRPVALRLGDVLYEQDEAVDDSYFFTSGAVSLMTQMQNGATMESAIIGREGMLGFPIGLGEDRSPWQSTVQIPGQAYAMSRAVLREQLRSGGDLPLLLTHYAGLLVTFVAQSAACAQFHSLERRTARWLLLLQDRAEGDELALTHESLAQMLGAYRPSETNVLHVLSDQGLIELRRGIIGIRDRTGLLARTCECYARVQAEFEELVRASETSPGWPSDPGNGYPRP